MSERHEWAGRFVWYDLMSTDVAASKAFYAELFGWSFDDMKMGEHTYTMAKNAGRAIGGIVALDAGFPFGSHWMSYLTVADVDAACERVTELGGKVCHAAFDLPNVGRTAIVEDPNGAVFHLFRSATPGASAVEGPMPHGHWCWTQLMTSDREAAGAFYTGLVPWETHGAGEYGEGQVALQRPGDEWPLCSMMTKPAEAGDARDQWMGYVNVESCAETTARAEALGATVLVSCTEIPDMGIFSVMADPTGAQVAIWQSLTQYG